MSVAVFNINSDKNLADYLAMLAEMPIFSCACTAQHSTAHSAISI